MTRLPDSRPYGLHWYSAIGGLPMGKKAFASFIAGVGTSNSKLQRVQVPIAGTVPSHLSNRSLRFFMPDTVGAKFSSTRSWTVTPP
jgi:hypothetical protein